MNSPLPVAVIAGAYFLMMSCGVGFDPGVIELNVWRMAATVPISPSSGNHSAPCARWLSQRSARSSKSASAARHRRASQANTVCPANSVNPSDRMTQSTPESCRRAR